MLYLAIAIALAYGVATVILAGRLRNPAGAHSQTLAFAMLGAVGQALLIWLAQTGSQAWNLSLFHSLCLVSWLSVCTFLLMTAYRTISGLGVVLLPFAAIACLLLGALGPDLAVVAPDTWQIRLHAGLSLIAFSVLILTAAQGILLVIQDGTLRRGSESGLLGLLPPLVMMEQLFFQMLLVGFSVLTLALVSGALFVEDLLEQDLAHKTILSVCAWCVFAVVLTGRWRSGWRGPRAVKWAIGGMLILLVAFVGSKLVLEIILNRPA